MLLFSSRKIGGTKVKWKVAELWSSNQLLYKVYGCLNRLGKPEGEIRNRVLCFLTFANYLDPCMHLGIGRNGMQTLYSGKKESLIVRKKRLLELGVGLDNGRGRKKGRQLF